MSDADQTKGAGLGADASRRPRILVVEDDDQIREMCRSILEEAGYDVAGASNGVEAVRRVNEQPTDVVICDIFMPEKDGIETIRELSRSWHGIKIIAISGGAMGLPDFLPTARAFGATAVLAKPFTPDDLLATVRAALTG